MSRSAAARGVASPVRLIAPAKLTLSLRVAGVRADGYHLIDAVMTTLDLCDELTLAPGTGLEAVPDGAAAPAGPDNLVTAALALAGRRARVVLRKRIGVGAGLGGGSADAAAVLRWANSDLAPGERPVDVARACRLGADVGFCLAGGRARVTGIGDRVSALGFERQDFTLLTPPFAVSSADVYAAWDGLPDVVPDVVPAGLAAGAVNDLEPAALAVAPELALWRDALAAQTGLRPRLAGSGATWFVEGRFPDVSHAGVAGRCVSTTGATPAVAPQHL